MNIWVSLLMVIVLTCAAFIGIAGAGLYQIFGTVVPYTAITIFLAGTIYRILKWARSPVPFRITTTCGQQKSLPWIRNNNLESPHNLLGVIGRMALEVLFFRSLFRNSKSELTSGQNLVYGSNKWLWLGGLAFHYSFLIVLTRHLKFFTEPVLGFVLLVQQFDGFFQVGLPIIYITDAVFVAAVSFLILRRIVDIRLRYLSLAADYFPLFLIIGIASSGILMRYLSVARVDVVQVKELAMGLVSFKPVVTNEIGVTFFIHIFLVSVLLAYFPFSKLVHSAGVFLSPSRNLANNNRIRRHINPWNPAVKVHSYAEYEDEFREPMKAADMPVEKE